MVKLLTKSEQEYRIVMTSKGKNSTEISHHIIKTAHNLFEQYGVNNVSMHQIAITAEVGQGTLYRRFANKAELCSILMQEDYDQFITKMDLALNSSVCTSVKEKFEKFLYNWLAFLDKEYEMIDIIRTEFKTDQMKDGLVGSPLYRYLNKKLTEIMREAIQNTPKQDIDVDFFVFTVVSSINSYLYNNLKNTFSYSLDEIFDNLRRMFINPLFI